MNSHAGGEETQYRIQAGLQWRWCLGGVVVLGADAADALHIGPPAARWFVLLKSPVSLPDLVDSIDVDSADVDPGAAPIDLTNDTLEALGQLCDLGIVIVVP